MSDLSLLTAVQVVEKTMAYTMYRQMMWFAICFAYLFATLIGAGTALALSAVGFNPSGLAMFGGLLGFGLCGYLLHKTRRSIWVPLRAGHAAAIAHSLMGKSLPGGWAQVDDAKHVVEARFGGDAALFNLHQRIKRVIRAFADAEYGVGRSFAFPGGDFVRHAYDFVLGVAVAILDEVILAYHIKQQSDNPFMSCRDGIILLVQNRRIMIKWASIMLVFMYSGLFAAFYLLLWPVGWVADLFPVSIGYWRWVFALVFAWGIKATFFDSVALAMLTQVFFKISEGQSASEDCANKLAEISTDFKAISDRAERG